MKYLLVVLAVVLLLFSSSALAAPPKQSVATNATADWQSLLPPQTGDFYQLANKAGGYSLQVPKAFGENPLAGLPHADGPMQLRAQSEALLCAVNVQAPQDKHYYNPALALPELNNKELLVSWQHGNTLVWNCSLSRQQDYYGDKLVLEATAPTNGKTYELLYVLPTKDYARLLSQALWSLNSFEILNEK